MKVKIEIKGLEEVARKFAELGPAAGAVLEEAVAAGADELKRRMITNAPGGHIDVELRYADGSRVIYYVGPDKAHYYYAFFETGTKTHWVAPRRARALKIGDRYAAKAHPRGIAAKPFMRPAVDEGQDAISARVGEVVKRAIDKV